MRIVHEKVCLILCSISLYNSFAVASEAGDRNIPVEVAQLTDSLKKQFAPDRRVALLDVDYSFPIRM